MKESNTHGDDERRVSRRTFVGTTGAAATVSLAGCIGGDDEVFEEDELTFWHQEGVPHRVDVFEEFTDRFNEEHDEITITQEPQNWDEVFGALTSALDAGEEPDFMFSLPAFTMTFQSRGDLVDVTDLVERIDDERSFFDPTVRPFQYDGGTWGVPMWDMVYLNHHRADVYEDADAWPPDGWDDWLEATSDVTDADADEYGICLPANRNLWTTQNLYTLMINNDAYVYGPDGGIMFDTPETVETLEFYAEWFDAASPPDATGWGWAEWERSLFQETTFATNGFSSWIRGLQETDHADQWEAIQQPYPDDGQPGSVHYVNNIMVFNEDALDAIGEFVEWLHQPDVYGEWLARTEPTLYLPVTEDGEDADAFWDHDLISQNEEMVQTQFDAIPDATIYGFREMHIENDLYLPSVGELEGSHVLAEVVQELIVNERPPEEAAEWGQERIEEVLEVERSDEL
ncbi:hypothetical protein CV102_23815 [Natronococcus pandeyae]|uniref:Extracellular solute-binding protein n=1 Tax=Natronococcus pandeyae TaxID=2055836 RepID=A0A8J8TQ53_9EURY|nr:extracellular solute-binding protein [Natronococcus pandeyae]TYL36172.1 hypothetical protein CV102_23815 [Natronococcus pandeyae]